MLINQDDVNKILCCPIGGSKLEIQSSKMVSTCDESLEYSIIDGCPILVDFSKSILDEKFLLESKVESCVKRSKYRGVFQVAKRIISPPKKVTARNVKKFISLLKKNHENNNDIMILVVGGGSVGQGMEPVYNDPQLKIASFDIYKSDNIQFVADAHNIPLPEGVFDCVIIQAVLEHVLVPQKVVNEITRVLKQNGIVYSETPFLQHVHEGAYDFTRFTESGHRYLYKDYEEICSGTSAGVGTQILWSVDYFFRSLFRSRNVGKVFKVIFFWLQYLDLYIPEKYSIDAASGVFFLGKKSNYKMTPKDIVKYYKGAQ